MKKYIFIIAAFFCLAFTATSCSDLLETESHRQTFDPELNEKTDSMFYTLGILKGVQQAIDQYVLVNEMRGDLTAVNQFTEADIRSLANFSATVENKYDSAYVFYRIINNCNYFIAHRDTSLLTGSRNVTIPEYVQAKSIRAWAYIQLAKIYGEVPFFTDPVTSISEANEVREKKDIKGICAALADDLIPYSGTAVPNYNPTGQTSVDIGRTNSGSVKYVDMRNVMFPVDLVLGDLYLESGDYLNAAKSYFEYLRANQASADWYLSFSDRDDALYYLPASKLTDLPADINFLFTSHTGNISVTTWNSIFSQSTPQDVITYVPMAVNKTKGQVTSLPRLFGYNYYTTDVESTTSGEGDDASTTYVIDYSSIYLKDRQIDPSQAYLDLSDSQEFYYVPTGSATAAGNVKTTYVTGDLRRYVTMNSATVDDSTFYVNRKYMTGNVNIYRTTQVYLRLAEALNRMGYPDAAFAILKDGLNVDISEGESAYVRPETIEMLKTTIPFFSDANISMFQNNFGIHCYGSGYTEGLYSSYQYDSELQKKATQLNEEFGLDIQPIITTDSIDEEGNVYYTVSWNLEDQINIVEDLICDEYALELAFEGYRFGDLCRIARHKNQDATYGSNFGGRWIAKKLENKNAVVDLTNETNWYLPFSK
ncbi:MAG: RagB/SusD family nutrient uptake outer membrane protein [Prevotella sp.]|nr:RagB/SusD family nutrient uptake outer membrane protein [Prevotella sp.]